MELKLTDKDLLIFDLNDTLIPCQIRYDMQKAAFVQLLLENFGQHVHIAGSIDVLIRDFDALDDQRAKQVGFTKDRFQQTMRQFYESMHAKIAEKSGLWFPKRADEAEAIGASVHSRRTFSKLLPFPSATLLLDYLKERDMPRKLLTQGDVGVQTAEVEHYGMRHWFDEKDITVVPKKNADVFKQVAGDWDPEHVYVIDNAARYVNQGVSAGFKGIYVPFPTWKHEDDVKIEQPEKVAVLRSIEHIIDTYGETTAAARRDKESKTAIPMAEKNRLVKVAYDAQTMTYSPYSHYPVGVAVLATTGHIYQGCNFESKLYTPTIHAERLALAQAHMHGENGVAAVAVVTNAEEPPFPCGMCCEDINEFGGEDSGNILIIAESATTKHRDEALLWELLPHSFRL
ncbi:cytidine deaminase [Candidatus Woesearchaeota archaeon]|nr:cytidine deaminase [Candidatus Woesearchaeota archaeon]